jgi:hypothetical protein|tara:strand:+ start:6482 stop:6958 length:477 start_codon:yes stop_codon:yes gene_type:complete
VRNGDYQMTDNGEQIMDGNDTNEGIKGLRDKLKSVEQENKELKNVVKTSMFKDVGLDPNSGTGKMAFDLYDGKPNTSELGQWLKDTYNIDTQVQQNNEVAAAKIAESDSKLEQIQQNSSAQQPADWTQKMQDVIGSPETSVRDSLRAKIALQEQQKNQ